MNYQNQQRWSQMLMPYTLSLMHMQQMHLQRQLSQQGGAAGGPGAAAAGGRAGAAAAAGAARNGAVPQARPDVRAHNAVINGVCVCVCVLCVCVCACVDSYG